MSADDEAKSTMGMLPNQEVDFYQACGATQPVKQPSVVTGNISFQYLKLTIIKQRTRLGRLCTELKTEAYKQTNQLRETRHR